MLERLTPLFTSLAKALREEPSYDTTHWDTLIGRPPELPDVDDEDITLPDNVTLIVGAPVYFPNSTETHQKP